MGQVPMECCRCQDPQQGKAFEAAAMDEIPVDEPYPADGTPVVESPASLKPVKQEAGKDGVEVMFKDDFNKSVIVYFLSKPLGMTFGNREKSLDALSPVFVTSVAAGGHAEALGVKVNWEIVQVARKQLSAIKFVDTMAFFKEQTASLPTMS